MELTQAGQADVPAVLAILFGYLRLLREGGGVSEPIYEESRSLSMLRCGGAGAGAGAGLGWCWCWAGLVRGWCGAGAGLVRGWAVGGHGGVGAYV
jgi:hypothetical protein